MTTVPFAGCVMAVIEIGPASGSVSFVSTGCAAPPESSITAKLSFTATGESSTAVIVMPWVSAAPKPPASRAW